MDIIEASRIVGSQPRHIVKAMHRALGLWPWLNTYHDNRRREAAGIVLKNWKAHLAALNAAAWKEDKAKEAPHERVVL